MRYMPTLRWPVRGSRVITAGSVMNGPASPGQQVCTGSRPRSTSSPWRTTSWQAPRLTTLGPGVGDRLQGPQPAHLGGEPFGRLQLEDLRELGSDVVQRVDAEREAHAPLGAELVDQQRDRAAFRLLEEQRRAAGPHGPVDDLRHLEARVDLGRDADQLLFTLEKGDPLAQVLDHAPSLVCLV